MNEVFKTILESFLIVFIDDILMFLKSEEEHANHLHTYLAILGKKKFMQNFPSVNFG